jgi:fructokinase
MLDPSVRTPFVIQHVRANRNPIYKFTCPACGRSAPTFRPPTRDQAASAAAPVPSIFFFDRASSAALAIAQQVRASGGVVMFEPNGLGRDDSTRRFIELATVLKISDGRKPLLHFFDAAPGNQLQIQTLGSDGIAWRRGGRSWRALPGEQSNSLDSSGAGDWLSSVLLHYLARTPVMSDTDLVKTLQAGQILAAISCEYLGARGLYTAPKAEVNEKLRQRGVEQFVTDRDDCSVINAKSSDAACNVCLAAPDDVTMRRTDRLAAIGT